MKKLTILFLLIFCFSQSLTSQTKSNVITENRIDKHIYFGIGFGFGFFNPGDVNDYIEAKDTNFELNYSGVQIGVDFNF